MAQWFFCDRPIKAMQCCKGKCVESEIVFPPLVIAQGNDLEILNSKEVRGNCSSSSLSSLKRNESNSTGSKAGRVLTQKRFGFEIVKESIHRNQCNPSKIKSITIRKPDYSEETNCNLKKKIIFDYN